MSIDHDAVAPQATAERPIRLKPALILAPICACLAVWWVVSFAAFVTSVQTLEAPRNPLADGMVVVTGGKDRIEVAIALLEQGVATRLLISGVHENTNAATLSERTQVDAATFACCVDLDFAALDTAGNAREAARWLEDHKFSSALIVTSSYHVPRTLAELRALTPNVDLIAYPVHPSRTYSSLSPTPSWPLGLLAREFLKLRLAQVRRLFFA